MQGIIAQVRPVWQRNHMVRGEGRKVKGTATEATRAIRSKTGRVEDLVRMARQWSQSHLVTVDIRPRHDNDLTLIIPDKPSGHAADPLR